ncbi:hypothetical protein QFZ60_001729 [Arthrobacter sp. B2I5]|nr:hypothetical protein [Arthrobacter sp. B2I5]
MSGHGIQGFERVVHLRLGGGHPGTVDQLVALGEQLAELAAHLVQALLELVDDLVLGGQGRFLSSGGRFGGHLPADGDLGQGVELVGVSAVAGGPEPPKSARLGPYRTKHPLNRLRHKVGGVCRIYYVNEISPALQSYFMTC